MSATDCATAEATTTADAATAALRDCPCLGLADTAHASLVTTFDRGGHVPSTEQWAAIRDLLDHLEAAANDRIPPAVYVSAIPAGTGKTASLVAFASALVSDPRHVGTGILIACNRVSECQDVAEALQAHRRRLCVIAGKDHVKVLALGDHTEAGEAQIAVTTQAALKETLKAASSFHTASRYHYLGAARSVVCWDEAIAFNRPVVLDDDTVLMVAKAMRRQSEEAREALLRWSLDLRHAPEGPCEVPDFAGYGIDFDRLEAEVGDRDDLISQAKVLAIVSGQTAYLKRADNSGAAVLSHVPELPLSLLPVTVTDASAARGVHHESYRQMAQTRPLVYLREAPKTYHNLTIRLVPTAASRSTYRDTSGNKARNLIEMAVRYVRSVAPAEVLIVSYKSSFAMRGVAERTIASAIDARLTEEERGHVRHLLYGAHRATNDHASVRHVLLMGLNFVPGAAAYAASGAALDLPMNTADPTDHPTDEQVEAMRRGMLRDSTLQALLRGHARKGQDGDCGEMEAVIPQVRQTGLSDADYLGIFPGVNLRTDRSLMPAKPLTGRLKRMEEYVTARLAGGATEISNPSIYEALGIDRTNFSNLVRKPEWQAFVAALGWQPQALKGRVMGMRVVA